MPRSAELRAVTVPTGSGSVRVTSTSISAPISRSTSRKAVRVGFRSTFSTVTSESARTSAATRRKAALEASPGTSREALGAWRARPRPPRRPEPSRTTSHPEGGEQPLGVVAGQLGLADRGAALGL